MFGNLFFPFCCGIFVVVDFLYFVLYFFSWGWGAGFRFGFECGLGMV
jgi:hypothetical protein